MADELYYVAGNDGSPTLTIGIGGAYREFQSILDDREPPPLAVFKDQWKETWFRQSFGVAVTPADDVNLIERLSEVQAAYTEANRQAKRLKAEREQLIVLAMFAGYDFESIVQSSGQAAIHIESLASDTTKTSAVVGEQVLPPETVAAMEFLRQKKTAEDTKTRIRRTGPNSEDEREWVAKFDELRAFDEQRRESRKAHAGDEWYGVDCTEDEYELLQKRVDAWFG